MPTTPLEPRSITSSPTPLVTPASRPGPHPVAAATLAILLTAATVMLLSVLWVVVGRPVENLTGALIDGLAADALAFCLVAATAGGVGLARRAARS